MSGGKKEGFLRQAIRIAAESVERGGGPFGALVVRHGEVIARASNRVTANNDPTAHAEIEAIRAACRVLGTFQLEDCEIYASSEPCPMCLGAIYWARPLAVYYANGREVARSAGFDDELIYEEMNTPAAERTYPVIRLQVERADAPFRAWEAKADRIEY